ncbi:MAG: universal stress protein [Salegentibacter sp.]
MNVLILTDFSKVADNAGKYAVDFLRKVPANFYLLNIETFNFRGVAIEYLREKKGMAVDKLNKSLDHLREYSSNPEHNFQACFSEENLVNATRRFTAEKKIDLIVMGAAGRDSEHNAILGNHTYEIIRKIRCNILAVAEGSTYKQPEKIALPMDYSASLDNKVLKFFEIPGIVKKTRITVMEIKNSSPAAAEVELPRDMIFGQLNNHLHFVELEESAIYNAELLREVQEKFDMIVMLGKNLSVCNRLLHSKYGVVTAITNKLPILVLHA